jgi:C4-dicarboxylate-specific signal transduction histidine kinase
MPIRNAAAKRPVSLSGRDCLLDTPDARVRLAATTNMASTLAHEVNQPLTAASNYLFACARRLRGLGEGFEDVLAMIDHASAETLKAGEIIRRARDFVVNGRIAGRRENLRTMIERAILTLSEARHAEVEIATTVPLGLFVMADRVQFEQVLANLLANACDAMEGAGDGGVRRIEIGAARSGGQVVTSLSDSGPGLSGAVLAHLFEPLFTTKETGAGLGLAICATIVEAHGGTIRAENKAGGGAVFHVALPAAD